jgi:hypothetical protein
MTTTLEQPPLALEHVEPEPSPQPGSGAQSGVPAPDVSLPTAVGRPLAVATLSTAAAAMMVGGIFGSWAARMIALLGVVVGILWAWYCVRRPKNTLLKQPFVVVLAFGIGLLSLLPTPAGPAKIFSLMSSAASSGKLLRPPVPFDPGWRPILILLFALLGFATGWVALRRPQLALVLPLPVLALAAISQPAKGQALAGMLGFVPLLVALGLLFGGDQDAVSDLGRAFEIRRAIKSAPLVVGGAVLLVVLGHSNFLFPKPLYNPVQKPQKPKSIPLGKVRDRILFTVSGPITGPWKIGDLDTYSKDSWLLPPFDPKDDSTPPSDGVVNKAGKGDVTVRFTAGDLGNTSVLPGVVDPCQVLTSGSDVLYNKRTGTVRFPDARVPQGLTYSMTLPKYPTGAQLQAAGRLTDHLDPSLLAAPAPPPAVQNLLKTAPKNLWLRLDYLRKSLNDVVVASGAGDPSQPLSTAKVQEIFAGNHLASPYQIVATEALLARWAGIPSRIGYGFDGVNDEHGLKTVRPKNAANWLEVYFQGHGWVPLIGNPPRAASSLKPDPNAVNLKIPVSTNVAVQIYIPVEVKNFQQLYQLVRHILFRVLPFVAGVFVLYLLTPSLRRWQRRRKRRAWAGRQGLREEIAVEYAELRDALSDLNIGDVYDTPLEFLDRVAPDDEMTELAWLVTRCTYGDMILTVTDADSEAAREMAQSCRKRIAQAQPFQSRALAFLSRASLRDPYTLEVPNVRILRLKRRSRQDGAGRRRRVSRNPLRLIPLPRIRAAQ